MANEAENPFADMDVDWENTEKAPPPSTPGRLPQFNAYKGVCVAFDPKGDGNLVDREYFVTPSGTKAVKICLEILEPAQVENETVKGKTFEKVFWITQDAWPFVIRDASTILGVDIKNPKELLDNVWAGKTVEFGLRDKADLNGYVRSNDTHWNAWSPEKKAETGKPQQKTATKPGTTTAQKTNQGGTRQSVKF
jgi:hypothetical protein